ncbi:MAG TPA: lipopolysaccharide heptosyltransferase I [Vicinamibacteria bacterium]|jgi:lipopolysaccharide heptosyltransferase I
MNILVVRLSSMGDLVHTLPAVAALRSRFPDARIDWLVEARHREVLRDNPDVNDLIEVDTLGWRRKLFSPRTWRDIRGSIAKVRERRYDLVLDLQGTVKSAVSAFLARSDRRIGFSSEHLKERAAALLYTECVSTNGGRPHAIDRHLGLLRALDIDAKERSFRVALSETAEARAESELRQMGLSDFAVLNPGASWETKRWSPEKFGRLATAIERDWNLPSLVVFGPGEEDLARAVVESSGGAARLAPRTNVPELLPYIRKARLFVSGDTGPLHLASALGVPAVAIFGPTDPARNGPFGEGDLTVWKKVACSPCYKTRCPGFGNVCLTSIEVEDVLAAVRKRLEG